MSMSSKKIMGKLVYPQDYRYAADVVLERGRDNHMSISIEPTNGFSHGMLADVNFQNPSKDHAKVKEFFELAAQQIGTNLSKHVNINRSEKPITMEFSVEAKQNAIVLSPTEPLPYIDHMGDMLQRAIDDIQDQERVQTSMSYFYDNGGHIEDRHYTETLYIPTDQDNVLIKLAFEVEDAGTYRRATAKATAVQRDVTGRETELDPKHAHIDEAYQQQADRALDDFLGGLGSLAKAYDSRQERDAIFGTYGKAYDYDVIRSDGSSTGYCREPDNLQMVGHSEYDIAFAHRIFDHDNARTEHLLVQQRIKKIAREYGAEQKPDGIMVTPEQQAKATLVFQKIQSAINDLPSGHTQAFLSSYVLGEFKVTPAFNLSYEAKNQAIARYEALTRHVIAHDENQALDAALLADHRIADSMHVVLGATKASAQEGVVQAIAKRSGKELTKRGGQPLDSGNKTPDRRSFLAGALNIAIAAAVGGRARQNATAEKTGGKDAFIDEVIGHVSELNPDIDPAYDQEFRAQLGDLYDKMQPDFIAEVAGHGASELTRQLVEKAATKNDLAQELKAPGSHADAIVGVLASTLEPRIDAIIEWNQGLLKSGFVQIESKKSAVMSR